MAYLKPQFSAQRFSAGTLMITEVIKFRNTESYVDDTKIYFLFASKDIDSCLRQVSEDLKPVSE